METKKVNYLQQLVENLEALPMGYFKITYHNIDLHSPVDGLLVNVVYNNPVAGIKMHPLYDFFVQDKFKYKP